MKKNSQQDKSNTPIVIDIERMNKALDSKNIAVPSNLTREEKRLLILKHS